MMKYLVLQKGEGEGCDYTIGCNMRFDWVEADSVNDALQKTLDEFSIFDPDISPDGTIKRTHLLIVEECNVNYINMEEIYFEYQKKMKDIELEEKEQKELKRLRRKYGNY